MNYLALKRLFARMNLPVTDPNAAGWFHISCPFAPWLHAHGVDRSGGFAVKVEEGGVSAYDCKACKSHGRISGLARKLGQFRKIDYESVAYEADRQDMLGAEIKPFEEQFDPYSQMTEPLDEDLFGGMFEEIREHPEAVAFMRSRRVTGATCDKLALEYDPDKRRVVFPVRNHKNELFGWSGRTVIKGHKPKVLDYAGLPKRHLILGEERWRAGRPKLIVEGLFAYARMHEEGVEEFADIGALLGSTLTEEKANILKRHGCTVYALTDPDPAGDQCLYGRWLPPENGKPGRYEGGGLVDMLMGEIPVFVPNYPKGVNDPDDLSGEQVERMISSSPMAVKS